ncbi:MAG: UDP-N-acetylglucosamine 2-epimerase (hydrolyzing), partial [Chitinophagaceae bacterium]
CIITYPNCDADHLAMIDSLQDFKSRFPNAVALVSSLGVQAYLTALKSATLVIGNSSSGLFEAPSYHTPTVNIGFRQAGRDRSSSVFDANTEAEIIKAIDAAIAYKSDPNSVWENPYGDGNTAERIITLLENPELFPASNQKQFYDLEVEL